MRGAKAFIQTSLGPTNRNLAGRTTTSLLPNLEPSTTAIVTSSTSSSTTTTTTATSLGAISPHSYSKQSFSTTTTTATGNNEESKTSVRGIQTLFSPQEILPTTTTATTTTTTSSTTTTGETNVPPVLLLEGDEYYVSHDGIARTLYTLVDNQNMNHIHDSFSSSSSSSILSVEEFYSIEDAKKKIVLRKQNPHRSSSKSNNNHLSSHVIPDLLSPQTEGVLSLGDPIRSIDLEEIDDGMFVGAGTGGTTWESSIAMSMLFASQPDLLSGNVIELGSGIGFGGILNTMIPTIHCHDDDPTTVIPTSTISAETATTTFFESMTLTDYNPKVLEKCQQNVQQAFSDENGDISDMFPKTHVAKLDWYDFMPQSESNTTTADTKATATTTSTTTTNTTVERFANQYDTIIACDCAYLYPDIQALVQTMKSLIRKDNNDNKKNDKSKPKIHIVGPHNRGALHELISQLEQEPMFDMTIQGIEMQRYRLKPPARDNPGNIDPSFLLKSLSTEALKEDECPFASTYNSRFLHITCQVKNPSDSDKSSNISEID